MENILKLIELIKKLPLINITAFLLASSCFIFVPDKYLIILGVKDIRDVYRSIIGIVFIISFSIIIVNLIAYLFKKIKVVYYKNIRRKIAIDTLNDLSDAEQNILREMMTNGTDSTEVDIAYGIHSRLVNRKIIYKSSKIVRYRTKAIYSIQPWAKKYLQKNMHIINDITIIL